MARRRLDAWKEIATYLGRDVTTVRRWERREGLPVHRHLHDKLGSIYAYADEIDEWMSRRSIRETPAGTPVVTPAPPAAAEEPAVAVAPVLMKGELREALPALKEPATITAVASTVSSRAPWRAMLAVAAVLAVGMSVPWSPDAGDALLPDAGDDAVMRVALTPPGGTVADTLALSPDGQQVLFSASDASGTQIWVRRVDSIAAEPLAGTDGASFPFWSADGQRFGFFANGRLKVFTLATREVRDLAAAPEGHGGTWNNRDEIVFAPGRASPLQLIRASGGALTQVTTIGSSFKEGHAWPSFLPDGRHFLYTDSAFGANRYGIYVSDLDTHRSKRILQKFSSAVYGAGGFLLYMNESTLVAQRFDPISLTVRGQPKPLAEQVLQRYDLGYQADFSVSRNGLIAARTAVRELNELQWIDRTTGRNVGRVAPPAYYSNPTLSPDARQLLSTVTDDDESIHLWSFDVSTGQVTRISSGTAYAPLWSPPGTELLFAARGGLLRQPVGGRDPAPALSAQMPQVPESWSGRYVTVSTISPSTKSDVWVWTLGDHPHATPLINGPANERQSRISPDGRYVAYVSNENGRFDVWVQAFPVANGRWLISPGGGADPLWSRDGHELFYVALDRQMMAVPVTTKPTFNAGHSTPIFKTQLDSLWMDTRNHYDTADGRRFVIIAPATDRREAPFTLISNWSRRLRR